MKIRYALVAIWLIIPNVSTAESLRGLLDQSQTEFKSAQDQNAKDRIAAQEEAARRAAQRDRSRDFCFALPNGSDAQKACRSEFVSSIEDKRAWSIMHGFCGSLGPSSDFNNDLSYICSVGSSGCGLLDDSDASYWCRECGGTRSWLATYSLGYIIQCFKN